MLETVKIGAESAEEPVPKLTVSVATSYCSGPTVGGRPAPPGATPAPTIAAMLHGEIEPTWPSAPFTKLTGPGPGARTVRLNTWLYEPIEAVTVAAPAEIPAVAVTCATPLELVVVELAESVTGPFAENETVTPASGCPLLPLTITASGLVNAAPSSAVWPLPPPVMANRSPSPVAAL